MMANYQNYTTPNGDPSGRRDTGFLRLLQVDLASKTMAINTYSPSMDDHNAAEFDTLDRYTDADDEFDIDIDIDDSYAKRVQTASLGVHVPSGEPIGTVTAAIGGTAEITWGRLRPGTNYGWYAEATDGDAVTVRAPLSSFITAGGEANRPTGPGRPNQPGGSTAREGDTAVEQPSAAERAVEPADPADPGQPASREQPAAPGPQRVEPTTDRTSSRHRV